MQLENALNKKNILIIDNKAESRSILKRMLESAGATNIHTALDGIEAMQKMGEINYDIVFSDYDLGKGKDGQQILEEARHIKLLELRSIFIMVTSENAIDRVMGALEYEPDNYITRPFALKALQERIEQSLKAKFETRHISHALTEGDYKQAIQLCHEVISNNTTTKLKIQISRILGKLYLKDKQFDKAQAVYAELLESHNISWAQLGLAVSLFHQGKINAAESQLRSTLNDHPLYVQCYDWLAKIHTGRNQLDKAQEELELAVGISPNIILRQMELGRLALENEDFQIAKNAFSQSISLGKHSCYKDKQNYLDYTFSVIKDLPNSKSLREKRLQIDRANRALSDFRAESTAQFEALYNSATLEVELAQATEDKSRQEKAIAYAQQCYKQMDSPSKNQQKEIAGLLILNKEYVEAQKHLLELKQGKLSSVDEIEVYELEKQIDPIVIRKYSTELNERGIKLYKQKRYSEAVDMFNEATTFDEAGIGVLMNAIQTKLAYAQEHPEVLQQQTRECDFIFSRISHLKPKDKRYARFKRLKDLQLELQKSL